MVLMIDYDDATFPAWGVGGVVGLVLTIILLVIAMSNDADCAKKTCPNGGQPRLMDHDCLCAEKAK